MGAAALSRCEPRRESSLGVPMKLELLDPDADDAAVELARSPWLPCLLTGGRLALRSTEPPRKPDFGDVANSGWWPVYESDWAMGAGAGDGAGATAAEAAGV